MSRIGSRIPSTGELAVAPGLGRCAAAAEAAGAASVWVADHVVMTREIGSRYPYAADGRLGAPPETPWFEALTACAWAAASTSSAMVGTAVLVLPQRHPIEVAKMAATIDALSGGRMLLGVGAGWYREEFEALGWDFATRGPRLDESIEVMRACWTGAPEPFEGQFFTIPEGLLCYPRPASEAGVPVLVGGMTKRALTRTAAIGDGWLAHATMADLDVDALATMLEWLNGNRAPGRDPLRAVLRLVGAIRPEDVDATVPILRELTGAGFDEIIVDPPWDDVPTGQRVLSALCDAVA
jgi:probable F420-dependent oxidoreductase